jgi:hypothetical protein
MPLPAHGPRSEVIEGTHNRGSQHHTVD